MSKTVNMVIMYHNIFALNVFPVCCSCTERLCSSRRSAMRRSPVQRTRSVCWTSRPAPTRLSRGSWSASVTPSLSSHSFRGKWFCKSTLLYLNEVVLEPGLRHLSSFSRDGTVFIVLEVLCFYLSFWSPPILLILFFLFLELVCSYHYLYSSPSLEPTTFWFEFLPFVP